MDLGSALDGSGKSLARFYWLQHHCVSELLVLSFVCGLRHMQPGRKQQAASSKRQASSLTARRIWDIKFKTKEKDMSKSYPIWIDVSGDNYKNSKSFGSRDHVSLDIKVGSSARNSNDLARVSIHMREDDAGNRTFALAVDGLVLRSAVMTADKKFYHRDPKVA